MVCTALQRARACVACLSCLTNPLNDMSASYSFSPCVFLFVSVCVPVQMVMATTGDGYIVPLIIQNLAAPVLNVTRLLPGTTGDATNVRYGCNYASTGAVITNTGGTGLCLTLGLCVTWHTTRL